MSRTSRARRFCSVVAAAAAFAASLAAGPAAAQGLLWSLPPDGTEVRYQGTLRQTDVRPGGEETEMTWDRQLTVRSVGTQPVQWNGQTVPGRWIEFELVNGKATEQGIDPGPVGTRIYKVLVPEPAVTGRAADERGIPNAFLPIVEGYAKVGEAPPQRIDSGVFQAYPTLTLLMNYKPEELKAGAAEAVDVPAGSFQATTYEATTTLESRAGRTENAATLAVSPDAPFGPVRWTATVTRMAKDPNQTRGEFAAAGVVEEQMEAREVRTGAKSALPTVAR